MVPIKYSKIKDGLYSIEEDGRVYSHYSKRYMKTSIDKDGYKTISLRNNTNGYSHFGIHRLLMITFRPITNMEEMSVDHIDGNKMNNSLNNLQWVTPEENTKLAYLTGLSNTKGENHGKSKITEEEALKIIALLKEGHKSSYIIKQIPSANKGIISSIKNNRTWKHLPR